MMKNKKGGVSWKWVVMWSLWAARLVRQPTPALRLRSGLLQGSIAHDGSHIHYLGIPYASVEQRFQGPGPQPIWNGVFEAINEHVHCYQKIMGKYFVSGQRDCLVLNVFTPIDVTHDEPLPVMVVIHGGGFLFGSSSRFLYGPEYLVAKRVILVTFNYRLGVLGFLSLGIREAPGNAGLKDQVAALKWVQRNIRAFGGDPDNVTILGESAGAASVSMHILSPMSKGLFHKAITQSGSALAPWAMQLNPIYSASLLARTMGYHTDDPFELYSFFMNKTDLELITTHIPRFKGDMVLSEVIFVPCVERATNDGQTFLTDLPYNLLSSGNYSKVPMIIGSNNEEGHFFASFENEKTLSEMSLIKSLPTDLIFPSKEKLEAVAEDVRLLYMDNKNISKDTVLNFSKFIGETFFNYPSLEETELILNSSDQPVYNYWFNYNGWRNFAKFILGLPYALASGAVHADDLLYLFKPCMTPSMFENQMITQMTTLWTNFAKYGNPGAEWPRGTRSDPRALVLGSAHTQPLWHLPSMYYWRDIYRKYRRKHLMRT